jgi:hypothetical protein
MPMAISCAYVDQDRALNTLSIVNAPERPRKVLARDGRAGSSPARFLGAISSHDGHLLELSRNNSERSLG